MDQRLVTKLRYGLTHVCWKDRVTCQKTMRLVWAGFLIFGASYNLARADQFLWAMADSGNGHLYQIDLTSDTSSLIGGIKDPLLGDVGSGWSTVGESSDQVLYFVRRFENDIHVFSLDSTNIQVSGGVITNVQDVGSTGLGNNIDGLTLGPDGNVYFTAFDQSNPLYPRNGLFRFHPSNGVLDFVGTFAGDAGPARANSFYTDLAFDPITGDVFGTGIADNIGTFVIYRLPGAQVLTGSNQSFAFTTAFPIAGLDGLAFDAAGQLYESSDSGGVFAVDRNTGVFEHYIANTQGSEIGSDLATSPVPEPASLVLMASALLSFGALRRFAALQRPRG